MTWSPSLQPAGQAMYDETQAVELGLKFHADVAGTVKAIRFYQDPATTPISHAAHLWSASGTLLATVTFAAGAGGWRQAELSSRVSIKAGVDYWVSYYASDGWYDASVNWPFPSDSAPLHATAAAYHHLSDAFPDTISANSANYWVDVVFQSAGGNQNEQ